MDLTNTTAYLPFMNDEITLRERTTSGWQSTDISPACVTDVDSTASFRGLANGWTTSVIFKTADHPSLPTTGSRVTADPNGKWDELTVAKAYHQGTLTYLLCTTQEIPLG